MHASTQMTIHNVPGVKWASKFGFKRVVLSRELGILEVEEIIKKTRYLGIEIEIFGHGALCYSYSGQCLLSSFIGGRSGNKGMCAQPCRKRYILLSEKLTNTANHWLFILWILTINTFFQHETWHCIKIWIYIKN